MSHPRALIAPIPTVLLIALFALIGCASDPEKAVASAAAPVPARTPTIDVTRAARYTLIEIAPDQAQRNLMDQLIEVSAPQGLPTTVADMLHYVLLRSGYRICEGEALARFEILSLPAPHFRLGPITLRDALEVLTGPAWQLAVDDASRHVCFIPADQSLAAAAGVKP